MLPAVLRIATFVKSGVFQALCEMSTRQEAEIAQQNLHLQYIYEGCCQVSVSNSRTFRIRFSLSYYVFSRVFARYTCARHVSFICRFISSLMFYNQKLLGDWTL